MKGIDISAWQTQVDWQALVDEGIEFVILKLGQRYHGDYTLDDMFVDHVNNAVAHGLKYGIYFYSMATTADEAQAEAQWVHEQIQTYLNGKAPEMGIWYDVEDSSQQFSDVGSICGTFVYALNGMGYTYVGIYSSYNWLTNGIIPVDQLASYIPYWVAQYNYQNDFILEHPDKIVRIWQFTDHYSDELPYDGNIYYE